MKGRKNKLKLVVGWASVIASLVVICLWTYWGVNEAFHEGWYYRSLWQNLGITLGQYLLIPIILVVVVIMAIRWRKMGVGVLVSLGLFALWFFDSNAGRMLIFVPLLLLTGGFWWGEIKNKKMVVRMLILVPSLIVVLWGLPLWWRVEHRHNDGDFGERVVVGNGLELVWAERGLGFVAEGVDWETAREYCQKLDGGGVWRLPAREVLVRSLTHEGVNAGGNMIGSRANYRVRPDKETPLWDPHSKIIYYWTSEEVDEERAYLVAYNGRILMRRKSDGAGYLGYRCVKSVGD